MSLEFRINTLVMKSFSFIILVMLPLLMFAQKDEVLLRINGRSFSQEEFESVFRRNNVDVQIAEPKTPEEYLELFIDFNLKVMEAIREGLDQKESFHEELARYRSQLARPYFNDNSVTESLVLEAYDRMQYDIRASHILIGVGEFAHPEDTLRAYNQIMDIRRQILEGASFEEMARMYSDDPSARDAEATQTMPARPGNGGDLGFFTVFNMVYPFESAAYNAMDGMVTMPVRTAFGYHLIKVTNRLPAMGTARVAHIMLLTPPEMDARDIEAAGRRMQDIYEKLVSGEDFETLVREYSEDYASSGNGGLLPSFTSNRMVPEFIEALHELREPGDFSRPLRSLFGWHIIQLRERLSIQTLESLLGDIRSRVSRDGRAQLSRQAVIDRLKIDYQFADNTEALNEIIGVVDNSVFEASWKLSSAAKLEKTLFSFDQYTFSQQDFAEYLYNKQARRQPIEIKAWVMHMYDQFVSEKLIAHEDEMLESRYPEFRAIMQEYHDGILLFEITDRMVWSRAIEDTLGLRTFYMENREAYRSDDRMDLAVFRFSEKRPATAARRQIARMARRGADEAAIVDVLNASGAGLISARSMNIEKGQGGMADIVPWKRGVSRPIQQDNTWIVAHVLNIRPAGYTRLGDIRGQVIADYQNYLERQWVESLRNRYDIIVNRELLKNIKP